MERKTDERAKIEIEGRTLALKDLIEHFGGLEKAAKTLFRKAED